MVKLSSDPADQRILLHELTGEIEALRRKRQEQWREGGHPDAKRFTQEELVDLACPSYKNLLLGRTNRLPARAVILAIANYLECTIHETNDLLLAAQYLPEVVELREDEQQVALERAQSIIRSLPLPAAIMSTGWRVVGANESFLKLNRLTTLSDIPLSTHNSLQWFFDPQLPMYQSYARDLDQWQVTAIEMIALFRAMHLPYRNEPWYKEHVSRLHGFSSFRSMWDQGYRETQSLRSDTGTTINHTPFLATPIRVHVSVVTSGPSVFPHVIVGTPIDAAAYEVYGRIGCTVAENRWEQALAVGGAYG